MTEPFARLQSVFDRRVEVLSAFAEFSYIARGGRAIYDESLLAGLEVDGGWYRRRELRRQQHRAALRAQKAAQRPPCPGCGAVVVRDAKRSNAKLPKYCSKRCGAAYRARLSYVKLSPEAFAAAQEQRKKNAAAARWVRRPT